MNITLGKHISTLRREKGLKQDELAEILNVSPQAVSKWENDQTCPDISLLPELAKTLGVSVDELLSGKSEAAPDAKLLPESERKDIKDMMIRILVTEPKGDTVKINIPMALLQILIDNGLNGSQISGNDALKSVDFIKIMELAKQGAVGNLVEVEDSDGTTVQIFVE